MDLCQQKTAFVGLAGINCGNGINTTPEKFRNLLKCKGLANTAMPVETLAQDKAREK